MDEYRQLQEHLRALAGGGKSIAIYQGIVKSVDGTRGKAQSLRDKRRWLDAGHTQGGQCRDHRQLVGRPQGTCRSTG
ncbi:hypothetical protein [Segatella copri]|uniref:hypothetical protein n=1 Tax=Segatella copri TaxID=165179 RepID=UPI0034E60DFB